MGKGVIHKHLLNRELISILQVNLSCRGKSERDHMALSQENNRFAACKKKTKPNPLLLRYVVLMADLANDWHNIIECNFKNHRIILHWLYMPLLYGLKSQSGSKCLCLFIF